nr:ABC transporter permease [Ktedonobacterales bacterium]
LQRVTDPRLRLGLSPLALVFPIFLLVAVALLFLRVFPLLLRLAAWAAVRLRGATAMVALAQMARSPRRALRMTLLFALATAFAIFVVIFLASDLQRASDVAAFQAGADFSGQIPAVVSTPPRTSVLPTLGALEAQYANIPGVRGASAGYVTDLSDQTNFANPRLVTVDINTYASVATWTRDDSAQPLADLLATLANRRATASGEDTIPVILDAALARLYDANVGSRLTLPVPGYTGNARMRFVVVAVVRNIPQVYAIPDASRQGGMLADYETFATIYTKDTGTAAPAPNQAWLRTADDAAALASVRAALASGVTRLDQVQDRRLFITDQQSDPLQINLLGVLGIGAAAALALALLGTWLASWLNARARLTNFAVLRALGTTPRQIIGVLLWEQSIVYTAALALGIGLGWLLAQAVLPVLIFANLVSFVNQGNGSLDVPPAHAILPAGPLAALLGALVVACALALAIMAVAVSRASLGQVLRLNED